MMTTVYNTGANIYRAFLGGLCLIICVSDQYLVVGVKILNSVMGPVSQYFLSHKMATHQTLCQYGIQRNRPPILNVSGCAFNEAPVFHSAAQQVSQPPDLTSNTHNLYGADHVHQMQNQYANVHAHAQSVRVTPTGAVTGLDIDTGNLADFCLVLTSQTLFQWL